MKFENITRREALGAVGIGILGLIGTSFADQGNILGTNSSSNKIYFTEPSKGKDKHLNLLAMDENGRNIEQVTHNDFYARYYISPNKKFLAYSTGPGKKSSHKLPTRRDFPNHYYNLYIQDLSTGREAVFEYKDFDRYSFGRMVWSLDSRVIGVSTIKPGIDHGADVFEYSPGKNSLELLCSLWSSHQTVPSFSPDRKKMVYNHLYGIIVSDVKPRDSDSYQFIKERGCAGAIWSPRGDKILFHKWIKGKSKTALFTMNPDGTDERKLSPNAQYDNSREDPSFWRVAKWSPDGTKVAFIPRMPRLRIPANMNINTLDVDTGKESEINLRGMLFDPRAINHNLIHWSPDGRKLLFKAFEKNQGSSIYRINLDGTGLKRLKEGVVEIVAYGQNL